MKLFKKLFKKNKWEKYFNKGESKIKTPDLSIYEYIKDKAKENPNEIAINYFNKKMTYKKLLEEIDICASALLSKGIRKNDVVTICMANTPEAVISFYAVSKIGAISNMIHPLSAPEEIKYSLESTNSVLMIAMDVSYTKIKEILNETNVFKLITVSAADSMPPLLKIGYYVTKNFKIEKPKSGGFNQFWDDFMIEGKKYNSKKVVKRTKEDPAVILHSGGTTGVPKNIVLTNGNINSLAEQAHIIFPKLGKGDSMLAVLPIFHCFGLVVCIHAPLCLGASSILVPQFDAKRFDKLFSQYHPTVVAGVPTLFEALLTNKYMDNMDLSYVKYVISGGDTLTVAKNEAVNKFFRARNCRSGVIQGYGMTETTGPIAAQVLGATKLGSIGIPFPSNQVKIVDPNTKEECPTNEVGEILVSGPTVMLGYLDNEKETNDTLEKDENGDIWVHTGDLGYLDEDGILFFSQRLKRMLIVSGYNVYPSHIEDVIIEHEAVLSCGVIGIPHPYKVQVPKAYIVLNSDYKLTNELKNEIKEHCERKLAKYMLPKEYEFRESLPKTMIGKVNYKELEKEINNKS